MNINRTHIVCAVLLLLVGFVPSDTCGGQPLPDDFPEFTITQNGDTAPGYLIGSVNSSDPCVGSYFMIMDNAAVPVLYSDTQSLGSLVCNGLFKYRTEIPGLSKKYTWFFQDPNFADVDTFQMGNGYLADSHDFQVLPNGHVLMLAYDEQIIDMSQLIEGGHPAARVIGAVIQELDVYKNVIFQWRSWDHIPILDTYRSNITSAKFPYIHVNSVEFDVIDGNIILSCRETSEVVKVSRVTGEVMWRMGGKNNDFTILDDDPNNAPRYFKLQHYVRRHANGHLTMFDNGLDKKDLERAYSRALEYDLDEEARTATMVWEYRNDPNKILALTGGSADRLSHGNTIINWGGAAKIDEAPAMTEADPNRQLVYEIWPAQEDVTGGFKRIIWPLEDMTTTVTHYELMAGSEYIFEDSNGVTGITLDVHALSGTGANQVSVALEPFAPLYPEFPGKAPRVLPVRVQVTELGIDSMTAEISFDAESFGFADATGPFGYADPNELTIHYGSPAEPNLLNPLTTIYNPVTKELSATTTQVFGQFILCFPDLAEVANPPILVEPADQSTVNQELPVSFFWTPRGFARSHALQISRDPNFAVLDANEINLTESRYTLDSPEPNTIYYYRVNTTNYGGASDWSTASFATIPPMVELTIPNGHEKWYSGGRYRIAWNDNLDEDVVLELYQDGVLVKEIDTVPSIGGYEWSVDSTPEPPGCDYAIKIKSSVNQALSDMSDQSFSIDVPTGDFDCDGCVQVNDLLVVAAQWLSEDSGLIADLDDNDKVDLEDFEILEENWTISCP